MHNLPHTFKTGVVHNIGVDHVGICSKVVYTDRDATSEGMLTPDVLSLDLKTVFCQSILAKWQQGWDHTWGNRTVRHETSDAPMDVFLLLCLP
jgi:hypothetical protein